MVWAHAFLDHAEPKVGSAVAAPTELRLWFTQEVEPAFVMAQVTDASGKSVSIGKPTSDPNDRTLLHLSLQKLPPGRYTVNWRVVSQDTHPSVGHFMFNVAP